MADQIRAATIRAIEGFIAKPVGMEVSEEGLERFFLVMSPVLDERQRRLLAGAIARMLGRGSQEPL